MINHIKLHKHTYALLILFLVIGFIFRYIGIDKNLSYWNDESHVALFARGILWHGKPINEYGYSTGIYQSALYYITALPFSLLGISEWAGRLPSVVVGTSLIAAIYIITQKWYGKAAGLISAFLMCFSQMQLSWSTQLRPYIWMELFTLIIAYLLIESVKNKKSFFDRNFIVALLVSVISILFHGIGLLNFALIGIALVTKCILERKFKYILMLIPLVIAIFGVMYFSIRLKEDLLKAMFGINGNTLHYRVFLRANYTWLLSGAALGVMFSQGKGRVATILLAIFAVSIVSLAALKINAGYVRYSLPAFPLLYILFSAGMVSSGNLLSAYIKRSNLKYLIIVILSALFLYIPVVKNKILLKPQNYYTINGDMRENPIVDYKTAFSKIEKLLNGTRDSIVMDAWNDRTPWYMPKQKFVWLLKDAKGDIDPIFGEKMIGTIQDFEKEKNNHPKGIVIVENWESLTPPDLQQHIRTTLKKEFDVNNLPYNEADKWSITVYSWGI